ncbi:hypothetical protein, conserved, partial [Eimeria tenella]
MEVICCGSYRRGRSECGDIDMLLIKEDSCKDPKIIFKVVELLRRHGLIVQDLQYKKMHKEGSASDAAAAAAAADTAAAAAAAAASDTDEGSDSSGGDPPMLSAAAAAGAAAAAAPRVIPLTGKLKGT